MKRSRTSASPVKSKTSAISKSLIARIAAPFASSQRSPVEQEIRLDEPFRQHFSGDTVKGAVLLSTSKPLRITHLVVRLHGFVKVVNNARLPGENIPYDENLLASMRKRKGIEYFGNGFARLFEDERVLCGDGRLSGSYEFRFELGLPSKNVPSSIDFEHGTISYLLTSTLTRPTTMSPTLTIHHKLNVTGTIDIAHLQPPKPRIVSLEAVSKKSKNMLPVRRKSAAPSNRKGSTCPSIEGASVNRLSLPSPLASDVPPESPVPSVSSSASTGESTNSACNNFRTIHSGEISRSVENLPLSTPPAKTITVKTELLQGGCLPGDTLQLRISIDHMKPVKTMQGLIITVFRQGRIDTHPALPIGPTESGARRQFEDYYPKSRTGLGGLSLSSAGSSRIFRQDIAQTITPLIIDPHSLNANIKTSIQMPDHAFPTITCVPGGMISFKYYVEIVIDLRGKLAGQDRFLPYLSITNAPQHSYGEPKVSKIEGINGVSYSATPGFNYLITDQIRRTKGVVFTTSEVIVGTKDSARFRLKLRESSNETDQDGAPEALPNGEDQQAFHAIPPTAEVHVSDWQDPPDSTRSDSQPPPFVPPPPSDIVEPQDEKSQVRRAEERLLPSSPPQEDQPSAAAMTPAAPFARDEEDFVNRYGYRASAPAYDGVSSSSRDVDTSTLPLQNTRDVLTASLEQPSGPRDDKQESEMHRLQTLRSAPEAEDSNSSQAALSFLPPQIPLSSASIPGESSSSALAAPSPVDVAQVPQEEDIQEILRRQRLQTLADSPSDQCEALNNVSAPPISPPPPQTEREAALTSTTSTTPLAAEVHLEPAPTTTSNDHDNDNNEDDDDDLNEYPPVYRR